MGEGSPNRWVYPILTATSTKEGRRTHTPYGTLHDLIGADGGVKGSPRPFYGFRWVHDLTGVTSPGQGVNQRLLPPFPVNFRVGDSNRAWGFVYVVWDEGSDDAAVFLEYRLGASTTWQGPVTLKTISPLTDGGNRTVSVVVQGIKVFVFIEGEEPLLFYYDEALPGIVVKTDTGPGPTPKFDTGPGIIVTYDQTPPLIGDPEILGKRAVDVLGQFNEPVDGEPARARLFLVGFSRYTGLAGEGIWRLDGPSELSLWTVPPATMADPVFDDVQGGQGQLWVSGLGPMGGASLRTGRPSSYYKFAYQLYDSVTGRKSNVSETTSAAIGSDFPTYNTQGEYILFGLLEIVWDSSKFDQCYVYRSVRGETDATTSILSLEAIITLDDYEAADQTGLSGDWKRGYYIYTLTDPVLVAQPYLTGFTVFEDEMPPAGAALLYDGSMLFGNTNTVDSQGGGLGVVRWSSPYEISPELVSPAARYYLTQADEEIIRFLRVGPNVIGYSLTGIYHFRKETTFIKATPIHEYYGGPSARGSTNVGSTAYMVTESGLKAVGPMGSIEDVGVIDKLVQEDWAAQIYQVEIAYDGVAEALYVLNPLQEHAAVIWLKTSQMTELYDMNFLHVTEGKIPANPSTSNSPLQARACFFSKVYPDGLTGEPKWRVWVPDYRRQNDQIRMLDHRGSNAVFTMTNAFTYTPGGSNPITVASGSIDGDRYEGGKVYVLQVAGDPDSPLHGKSATILRKLSTAAVGLVDDADAAALNGLPLGSVVGISPVFFKATGWACGLVSEQADEAPVGPFDYTRVRHAHSIGCTFSDVEGTASVFDGQARFAGMVYKGNKEQWENFGTWAFPTGTRGSIITSVREGPSTNQAMLGVNNQGVQGAALFPSIEIFTPDLDYTLLNIVVYGTVRQADTEALAR